MARTMGGRYREGGFDAAIAIDYVDSVVLDAVVGPLATRKVGIAPFSTMTRLGHDFLLIGIIRKHTFTEATASAVDAIWFADRDNPSVFDPNVSKGSAMRPALRAIYLGLIAVFKVGAWALTGCFAILRCVGWILEDVESGHEEEVAPRSKDIETSWSIEAADHPYYFSVKEPPIF